MVVNILCMQDEVFLREFGIRLKLYRIKSNFTQAQLGEMVNISEHRISQIENGKCNLTLKTVNRLAVALDVIPVKFFNFEGI
ncbi:helix-turn-helix transcriptional regulator [bacterium]|nr:helix-turn-helix transcriptional regulator [bacterium]